MVDETINFEQRVDPECAMVSSGNAILSNLFRGIGSVIAISAFFTLFDKAANAAVEIWSNPEPPLVLQMVQNPKPPMRTPQ